VSRTPSSSWTDPATVDDAEPDAPQWWREPWSVATLLVAAVLTALVLWPLYDLARTATDLDWRPSGDWAAIVVRTEDVGHLTPLLGPYSRFGWNHPGPLLFWLLALPYRLVGGGPQAILSATAVLNMASVIGIAVVAWRRGRLPLVALTMAALAIVFHSLGPMVLRDPWNPYVTLLPLVLLTFLAWSIAEGDRWMWVAFAFVASFEVQSHVGYAPMVVALTVVAFVLARRPAHPERTDDTRRRGRALAVAVIAVLVVCWLPALVDQMAGTGNARAVLDYFVSTDDRPAGVGTALHTMAGQLRVPDAPWLGATERAGADGQLLGAPLGSLVIPLVAFGGALWLARRRGASSAVRFQMVMLTLTAAGLVATARVVGPVFDWIVRWWWIIAALWWLSILWSLWSVTIGAVRSRDLRRALVTALAALAALVILDGVGPVVTASRRAPAPNAATSEVLGNFLGPVVEAMRGRGPVLVETTGSVRGDYGDAIRYALEAAGIPVAVPSDLVTHFGPERARSRRGAESTLWVVSADAIARFRADPSMVEVGGWDPLTPVERAAFDVDKLELQRQLRAAGRADLARALTEGGGGVDSQAIGLDGVDPDLVRRVEAIRRRGDPVAVFSGPPPGR